MLLIGFFFWLQAFFILLGVFLRPFFNISLWLVNMILILIMRGIYIFIFYLNYVYFPKKEAEDKRKAENIGNDDETTNNKGSKNHGAGMGGKTISFSKMNYMSFIFKNLLVLIIGTLSTYIALIIGIYSVYVAGGYLRNIGHRSKSNYYKDIFIGLNIIIKLFAPFIIFFAIDRVILLELPEAVKTYVPEALMNVILKVIPILIGILLYVFPGRFYANLSLMKMYKYYNKLILGQFERIPKVRKFLLILLIVVPSFFIMGIGLTYPMREHYEIPIENGKYYLATDVFFARGVGRKPAPVIIDRSPYGMREIMPEMDTARYNPQNYHVVIQDCRYTYESTGSKRTLLFTNAYKDGLATVEWALKQPWCNGVVATTGISAMAINSYYYAGMGPEGLKAQSLWFGTPDLIADAIVEGAYREQLVNKWVEATAEKNWRYQLDYIYDLISNVSLFQSEDLPKYITLSEPPNTYDKINVTALHVGGWYDIFLGGTIRGYMGYNTLGQDFARGHQKMIIGPWTHGMIIGGKMGDVNYPPNSNGVGLIMNWEEEIFNYGLRGIETPGMWDKKVAYYVMGDPADKGANYWKYATDWPLNYDVDKWYLGSENGALVLENVTGGAQSLAYKNVSYLYDPRDPVLTRGGNNLFSRPVGPVDQRPVEVDENGELRSDILLFQSPILTKPYTIEGDLSVHLMISSNCTDTDFMAKLCDVYPDGSRILILDGAKTARYRNVDFKALNGTSHEMREDFMTPGNIYNVTIDLSSIAYRFAPGHRIALTITSSNYDRFHINPNTGGPITDFWTEGYIANNTILTGYGKSYIAFPVINA
ncbi:MAG: CocE/NonD family hydrolase [Promethearchaeota archaeon]